MVKFHWATVGNNKAATAPLDLGAETAVSTAAAARSAISPLVNGATPDHWLSAVSADFNTAADWSTGTVPGATNDAILNAKDPAFDVTANTAETVNSIQLSSNATLDVNARTFTANAGTGAGANAGLIRIDNNAFLAVAGAVKNTGTIAIDSTGAATALFFNANTTLSGGGNVITTDNGANYIEGATASDTLTNVNNTISGAGQLGNGQTILINESKGVIDATGANALVLNTNGETATNAGLIEGTGAGGLTIVSTTVNNAGGTISAGTGSNVNLQSADIVGGALKSLNGGVIRAVDRGSVLDGTVNAVNLAGTLDIVDSTSAFLYLQGTIDNTGTINVQSAGHDVRLRMSGNTLLTGGGVVVLTDNSNNTIDASTAGASLTNVASTISGAGVIGGNGLVFINQSKGVVDATGTNALTLIVAAGGTLTNSGLLEGTGGGGLTIQSGGGGAIGVIDDSGGGEILAATGSNVALDSGTIIGGTLTSMGTGVITQNSRSTTLDGTTSTVVLGGTLDIVDPTSAYLYLQGTIDNTGTINLQSAGHDVRLRMSGNTVLTGGGPIVLTDSNNTIDAGTTGASLTNVASTISGAGVIGGNGLVFINQSNGVVDATGGNALTLDTGNTVANSGLIEATGPGGLLIASTTVNGASGGTILAGAASTVTLSGSDLMGGTLKTRGSGVIAVQPGGDATLDGTASPVINHGLLEVSAGPNNAQTNLTLLGSIDNAGTIALSTTFQSGAHLIVGAAGATLSGGGAVTLTMGGGNYVPAPGIYGAAAGDVLTNFDNTISGNGNVGSGQLTLANDAAGVIDATVGITLNTGANAIANAGTLEATGGGTLAIQSAVNNSTSGVILAGAASTVNISGVGIVGGTILAANTSTLNLSGADISGGTLQNEAGGVINVLDGAGSALIDTTVTNQGEIVITAGEFGPTASLTLQGAIDNAGTIAVTANGNGNALSNAYLVVGAAGVTLSGAGSVALGLIPGRYNGTAEITGSGTLTNFDNTISGRGIIAPGTLINDAVGVIDATGNLTLNSANITNMGTLETSGGTLTVNSYINGSKGTIFAGVGSTVILQSSTGSDGALGTAAGGTITLANGSAAMVGGATFSNAGTIQVESTGAVTTLTFDKSTALTGGGVFELSPNANNIVNGTGSKIVLTNVDNTIEGSGEFGDKKMILVNQAGGVIDGDSKVSLTINTGSATIANAGLIETTAGGKLTIASALGNTGVLQTMTGSLTVNGAVTGAGSAKIDGGSMTFESTFTENVAFTGTTGKLVLARSQGYTGQVSGFSTKGKTSFDLLDIAGASATYSYSGNKTSGVLTVTDGTHTANINLVGNYTNSTFILGADVNGGTTVTDPTSPPASVSPPPHAFVAAMAGLGTGAGAAVHAAPHVAHAPPMLLVPRIQIA